MKNLNISFKALVCLVLTFVTVINTYAQSSHNNEAQVLAEAITANNFDEFVLNYTDNAVTGVDPVSGLRPLHLACKLGKNQFVEFMLKKEQSMETGVYVTQTEMPPMVHAIQNNNLETIELLFSKGRRNSKGLWMRKGYLFHAYDLGASQATIDLLVRYGCSTEEAKKQMKQTARNIEQGILAQTLTDELDVMVVLDKYQQIDAYNIHLNIARLLEDVRNKYTDNATALSDEENEIMKYRNKQLKYVLTPQQFNVLR